MSEAILGIDVSKKELVMALLFEGKIKKKKITNDECGFKELSLWVDKLGLNKVKACLEATGSYGEKISNWLYNHNHEVSVINPVCIRSFAKSKLSRHNTDEVDALIIAEYASEIKLIPYKPKDPNIKELQALYRCLQNLKVQYTQVNNYLENENCLPETVRNSYKSLVDHIIKETRRIEEEIDILIAKDPSLTLNCLNLQTIPGIGKITAVAILAEIPDFSTVKNARQLAAYAGLTPSHKSSGTSVRGKTRISKVSSSALRKALYFPAIVAKNHNQLLKSFSDKLKRKGKHNMVIVIAIMRKLLHIVYGILKHNTSFRIDIHQVA